MNFLSADIDRTGDALTATIEGAGSFAVQPEHAEQLGGFVGQPMTLGIRAENIEVVDAAGDDTLEARVLVVEPLGSHDLLTVRIGSQQLKVSTRPDLAIRTGQEVSLRFEHVRAVWIDPRSERTIGM